MVGAGGVSPNQPPQRTRRATGRRLRRMNCSAARHTAWQMAVEPIDCMFIQYRGPRHATRLSQQLPPRPRRERAQVAAQPLVLVLNQRRVSAYLGVGTSRRPASTSLMISAETRIPPHRVFVSRMSVFNAACSACMALVSRFNDSALALRASTALL